MEITLEVREDGQGYLSVDSEKFKDPEFKKHVRDSPSWKKYHKKLRKAGIDI